MMKHGSLQIVFAVWVAVVLNDSAKSSPLPEQLSRGTTRSQGLGDIQSSSPNDYSDAIYAGKFAIELDRLEQQQKDVYEDFITAGFAEQDIPRDLPGRLQKLSRTSNIPEAGEFTVSGPVGFRFPSEEGIVRNPSRAATSSVPAGFAITPPPSQRRRQRVFHNGFRTVTPFPPGPEQDTLFSFNHRLGGSL
ncbi:uncharacterized protein LOC135215683 [Macrobrachium nipponense]|uniref:uncharacterized protein LOC135215683 n=1 Tax=Macrobrachium nipponense TaxID=159736 RepID=UPI0030C8BDF4